MADPTEAPRPGAAPETSGETPDASPAGSTHLDPPGMPDVDTPADTPAATDGWLEGPPPSAEQVLAAPQDPSVDGNGGGQDSLGQTPTESSPMGRASGEAVADRSSAPAAPPAQAVAPSPAPPGSASAEAPRAPTAAPDPEPSSSDLALEVAETPPAQLDSEDDDPPEPEAAVVLAPAGEEEVGEEVEEGAPAWMMTFGDMMSLLLTFFILLFSMSSIEVEKFKAATESLAEALGENNAGIMPDGVVPIAPPPAPVGEVRQQIVEERMDDIASQLEEFVRENKLEEQVVVSKESHGVFLRMQNQALFGPGSADIAAASVAIVEQLGAVLDRMDLPVKVSGHTDNVPIRSSVFPSNWELSAARAAGVARILVSRGHDPSAVAVEAFGEHQPVASNDTPEGRAENRRVELYFSKLGVEARLDERGELPTEDGEDAPSGDDLDGSDEDTSEAESAEGS